MVIDNDGVGVTEIVAILVFVALILALGIGPSASAYTTRLLPVTINEPDASIARLESCRAGSV